MQLRWIGGLKWTRWIEMDQKGALKIGFIILGCVSGGYLYYLVNLVWNKRGWIHGVQETPFLSGYLSRGEGCFVKYLWSVRYSTEIFFPNILRCKGSQIIHLWCISKSIIMVLFDIQIWFHVQILQSRDVVWCVTRSCLTFKPNLWAYLRGNKESKISSISAFVRTLALDRVHVLIIWIFSRFNEGR